ncbi:ACT domain protein [Candidatus Bilamarchaeum dharawalense]|uniref:ACT domain protein n=1 Tax=Candidatus Bilamarchaeum dharawalense TaxID=2885759 RepID=A0A5E4LKY3_9ARCH|nr:ACT domain protein [Candidatus Bilamarchaeum dharawalense]
MVGISDLDELLKNMKPKLKKEKYYMASFDEGELMTLANYLDYIICVFKENEGLSATFTEDILEDMKTLTKKVSGPFALITLEVHSDLAAVGFMAKIADVLAKEKISCNAVSAYYHDHIFVQYERKEDALAALEKLQK